MKYFNNHGFTLIELVLVIALIGIISTFAIPNILGTIDKWILNSTANMIANDIRLMQSKAIKESEAYEFQINTKDVYYTIGSIEDSAKIIRLNPRIISISSTLPNKGYAYYKVLRFSYSGSPSRGGTIILYTKHNSIKLTIEVTTGRVRIFNEV